MLTPDTIVPDPANPQSFNRYSYVNNNPINFSDPSGHNPICNHDGSICSDGAHDSDSLPDWWKDDSRVFVQDYGVFDIGHVKRGYDSAEWIWNEVVRAIAEGGGSVKPTSGLFVQEYWVAGDVTEDQIAGIVLGIYMDFEIAYEAYQGSGGTGFVGRAGAYAPEDLPSDYIGAWAFLNGYTRDHIPKMMEGLGNVEHFEGPLEAIFGERGGSMVFDILPDRGYIGIPRNFKFNPMVNFATPTGGVLWRNVPWPQSLQMTPIESSPTTWWVVN